MLPKHQRAREVSRSSSPSPKSPSKRQKTKKPKSPKRPRSPSSSPQRNRSRTANPKPKKSKFTSQPSQQFMAPKQPLTIDGITVERIPPHLQRNYKFALYLVRNGRKILVSNLPENINKDHLASFISDSLERSKALLQPGNPIISSNYSPESKFVFLTMRSMEETVQCLSLDGIFYRRKALRIKRPIEYETQTKSKKVEGSRILPKMDYSHLKICKAVSANFVNNFNKLFFTNFPADLEEENIIDVLQTFGKLRAFALITDKQTNKSKGFGHCEFENDLQSQNCLKKLNGAMISGQQISIKRAILVSAHEQTTGNLGGSSQYLNKFQEQVLYTPQLSTPISGPLSTSPRKPSAFEKDKQSHYALLDIQSFFKNLKISCVLVLRNIVPLSVDPEVIKKDLLGQLERVGPVVKIVHKGQNVWVEYEKVEYSQIAYLLLLNHKYDGKLVEVSFYDPIAFADNLY